MSNRLREVFTTKMSKEQIERLKLIKQELLDAKDCSFCKYAEARTHYSHGKDGGTDPFCTIHKRLILEYGYGSNCEHWKLRKESEK